MTPLIFGIVISPLLYQNVLAQSNVVHLNLCSHNEMSDIGYGVNYNTNYAAIKAKTLEVADSVYVNEAKWNMQVESNFIKACIQFDNASSSSIDLMETIDNLSYVEVDPHNHLDTIISNSGYNPYNYADLNHLLDSCGLTNRTNVGGFIYKAQDWTTNDQNWTLWKNGLKGRTFPWVKWTPNVLWGGGTLNHVDDPNPSGMWHPKGPSTPNYILNDPNQLLSIGNSCAFLIKDTTNVTNLLFEINNFITSINATTPNSNTFYTATIMFDFRYILTVGYTDKIAAVLRGLKTQVTAGKIVWQTLSEKKTDWLSSHNNSTDYFLKACDDINSGNIDDEKNENEFNFFPNPFSSQMIIQTNTAQNNLTINLYNIYGQKVKQIENIPGKSTVALDRGNILDGMYLINIIKDEKILYTGKVLVQN